MPYFDGTGPQGMGPLTGRGFGPCGQNSFGIQGSACGGYGFGRGRRRGMGYGWNRPQSKKDYLSALADYRQVLEKELEAVKEEELELQNED